MRSNRLSALLLALLLLSGCGVSGEEVLSVIAPTEAPIAVVETGGAEEAEEELPPEQLGCESLTGCFSPFWAEADGDLAVVERGVPHDFSSVNGGIFEEISTQHVKNDSIYDDPNIAPAEQRKTYMTFYNEWITKGV